jgi:nucleoside-diphosphate-sugar epimerase
VSSLPKAAQKATYNLTEAWQLTNSTARNVLHFVTGKLKPYQGMRTLMHEFYRSLEAGARPPVSKTSALQVVETMDAIFERLHYRPLTHENIVPAQSAAVPAERRVLVTGGSGFLGRSVVKALIAEGYAVRVLARKLSRVDALAELGAEVFWGDVADLESFGAAFTDCGSIVHLAAGTSGNDKDCALGTIAGTQNLVELCRRFGPRRVVYISSCSVYGIAACARHAVLSEQAPLEASPELRGSYSASKQEAERLVIAGLKSAATELVVLRPGTIYGPGGDLYTPMMGFKAGSLYAVIGMGGFRLPFVHVENVVAAISLCLKQPAAAGQTYNVVDPEPLTKRDYMNRVIRRVHPKATVVYVPYAFMYAATWAQELAFKAMKRRPVLSRYRLTSSQRPITYDATKLTALGWKSRVSLSEALEQLAAGAGSPQTRQASIATAPELAGSGTP